MVDDVVFEYLLNTLEIKVKFWSIISLNQSARLADKTNLWKECIQIIIHVWLFFSCIVNVITVVIWLFQTIIRRLVQRYIYQKQFEREERKQADNGMNFTQCFSREGPISVQLHAMYYLVQRICFRSAINLPWIASISQLRPGGSKVEVVRLW